MSLSAYKRSTKPTINRSNATVAVMKIAEIDFTGNIFPESWFHHLRLRNGKPDLIAMTLLADIKYWYTPTLVTNKDTGEVYYQKKFDADILQKDYAEYQQRYHYSKKQCREAFIRLEQRGIIKRHLRTVLIGKTKKIGNCLFIEIFPEALEKISSSKGKVHVTPRAYPYSLEVKTNTYITAETSAEKNNVVFFPKKVVEEKSQDTSPSLPTPSSEPIPFPLPIPEPKEPEKRKKLKSSDGSGEDQAFEEQWELYKIEALKCGTGNIGSKTNAQKSFKNFYREQGAEGSMFLMKKFFEWKAFLKKTEGFCGGAPHLERFYRDSDNKYHRNEQFLEFIKNQKPTESNQQTKNEVLQQFDDSEEGQFRKYIFERVEESDYNSLCKDLKIVIREDNKILIKAETSYKRDRVKSHPLCSMAIGEAAKKLFPGFDVEYIYERE